MSPTRQPPPIQIYQDFADLPPQHALPPAHSRPRPQLAPSAMPLQPVRNGHSPMYAHIQPGMHMKQHRISPIESQYPPMPADFSMNIVPSMTLPESTPTYTDSPQKRMSLPSSQPMMPAPHMPSQPMFSSWDSNFQHFDQENYHMQMPMPDNFVDFPNPVHVQRAPLKRSYSETVPSSCDRPFKRVRPAAFQDDEAEIAELPQPEDMPLLVDDGQKPPYSYAQMIGMAILRAPGRRLTLANIYEWISSTFQFYREDPKQTGWHNSIRHNLSLNKAFIKQERPKSDAGKGCYWLIQPGMEAQFFKDKPRKSNNSINMPMQQSFSAQPILHAMAQPIVDAVQPRSWVVQSQSFTEPMAPMAPVAPERPQTAPAIDSALPDLSSDATLPASDPALVEEPEADVVLSREIPDLAPPSRQPPPSSPPIINSSPPVMPRHHRTASSPANITRHMAKPRKNTMNGMDDSGYFSSLESSARRPRNGGILPTSELGFVPRKKVGRAEEEIARIRSSSHDITPSARRSRRSATDAQRSSSPLRQSPPNAPTTPPVVFKKPFPPPQSISPNTQLRRHREAMSQLIGGSPSKREDLLSAEFPAYSPAFKLATPGLSTSFDDSLFTNFDDFHSPATPHLGSSPTKPMLRRSNTSAGVLRDVTKRATGNVRLNRKTPSKIPDGITFKAPIPMGCSGSPLKKLTTTKSLDFGFPVDENENSLFDFGSFPDENSEEGEELDISKGFSKIGSATHSAFGHGSSQPAKPRGLKPAFSRSHTSRF